jgi:hypothetical protein
MSKELQEKIKRICKEYDISLTDLIVESIDYHVKKEGGCISTRPSKG